MIDLEMLEYILNNSSNNELLLIQNAIMKKYDVDIKILTDKVIYTRNASIVCIYKDVKKESLIKFIKTATVEFLILVKFFIDLGF